jgi:RNA polymerase sigma factor (sigma-70 family)
MSEAAAAGFDRLFSDARLTRRAVRGDERAFAAIFRRYHQPLYRFCLAIVGSPDDAQEALQNTMAKVLRALPGEEREIELKPWLYRIAHNESIDLLRRRRETSQLDVEQITPGYGLAEDAEARERLRRLLADLRELPERQREVLIMRELSGFEFEEIGAALGTSDAVARQTLYEARQSLRQMEEGREMSCAAVTEAISDGDGRVLRRRDVRAHLRTCAECRGFGEDIKRRRRDFAALSPLPAVAAAGMLQGLVGGSSGAAGGGVAATTLGGGAAKTLGASALAKGVATAAVVAAVGVTAADRSGVIHLGLPGEKAAKESGQGSGSAAGKGGSVPSDAAAGAGNAAAAAGGNQKAREHGAGAKGGTANGNAHGNARHHAHGRGDSAAAAGAGQSHGRGPEAQHPAAAANGQGRADSQQSAGKGSGGEHAAAHPARPEPAVPAPAEASKEPPSSPANTPAPEAQPTKPQAKEVPGPAKGAEASSQSG